jgi:3-hydroxyisobutyrate dehydrogenase-like beta-hydroxyacid dehydrogenase
MIEAMESVGILHPGEMGASVAASAKDSGHEVYWASQRRSSETHARANRIGLIDAGTLEELCNLSTMIISVCPPHAAEEVADQVLTSGFRGVYVDANAISPKRTARIARDMAEGGALFVDGSIIGGPAWTPGTTWLYLSGEGAQRAADCFSEGPLGTEVLGDDIGSASALKMCYAAYTKGSAALLCAVYAAAEALGVQKELMDQWSRQGEQIPEERSMRVRRVSRKAWRFAGEMEEIAETFDGAGMPDGFHRASAQVYRRMAAFKGQEVPPLEAVLNALMTEIATEGG